MATKTLRTQFQVRRGTTAEWEANANVVPAAGEPCMDIDTGLVKYGDGVKTYAELKSFGKQVSHYEVASLDELTGTYDIGDTAVVKSEIGTETGKFSYTAYVYNGTAWAAMDGNYDASNIYFSEDLIATANIGVITIPSSGSATIDAEGKNLKQVLASILAEEKNPSAINPAVSLTAANNKAYEVGTTVTPTFNASLSAGSYTYGPATGITAKTWSVTNNVTSEAKTTNSGSFESIVVADATKYAITAIATYDEGTVPVTNLGNEFPSKKIPAGSANKTSSNITGYRSFFYGALPTSSADAPLTSAIIRGLTNGAAYSGAKTLSLAAASVAGAKRVVVAVPASSTRAGLTKVLMPSAMNADATDSFVRQANVEVEGVNGYAAVEYKVWVYEPASLDSTETYTITLG